MSWLQLRLDCASADAAALEQALLDAGALSVTLEDRADQPLLEPAVGETPLWDAVRITGLFSADHDMDATLTELPPLAENARPRIEILEDKDWEREWMQHYRPMRFGRRLWICPSWHEPPDAEGVTLMLDPGLAFGTGTHATTAMCLEALDAAPLENSTVVDFGCGSGILGVAALKLGARRLLAVDTDPQALVATADNAARNGLSPDSLELAAPDGYDPARWEQRAQLVVANILAGPLSALSRQLCALLAPGGQLVLAGLLKTQADALIADYEPWLRLEIRSQRDEWVCLSGLASA